MKSSAMLSVVTVIVLLAAALALAFLLRGAALRDPDEALPRDTQLVLRAPDVPRLARDLARAGLGMDAGGSGWGLLADLVERMLQRRRVSLSLGPADLERVLRSEAVVALAPTGEADRADLALIVKAGLASERVVEAVRSLLDTSGEPAVWGSREHRGRTIATRRVAGGAGSICVAGLKGVALLTTSGALMRRIIDTLDGRIEPLRSDPAYRAVRQRLDQRADLLIYASGGWLRPTIDLVVRGGEDRGPFTKVQGLLGLDSVRGAGLAVHMRRGLFEERLFIAMAPGGRGLLGEVFAAEPRAARAPRVLSPDSPYYAAFTVARLDTVYKKLPDILAGPEPAARKAIRDRLSGMEAFLGLDLKRDLFAALGGEIAVSFGAPSPYPRTAGGLALRDTPMAISISLKDPAAISKILTRIDGFARAAAAYHALTLGGQAMTVYAFDALAPLTPAYRLRGDQLVAATSPEMLLSALSAASRRAPASVQRDLGRLLNMLPGKAHLVFCGDTGRLIDLLPTGIGAGGPVAPALPETLPQRLKVLAAQGPLPPTAAAFRMGKAGLLVEWIAPVSPSLLGYLIMDGLRREGIPDTEPPKKPSGQELGPDARRRERVPETETRDTLV